MRFYQSRQFQMMRNVAFLLKKNEKVISSRVPAMQEIIPDYVQSMDYVFKLKRGASSETRISAGKKKPVREALMKMILKLQGVIRAHRIKSKTGASGRKSLPHNHELVVEGNEDEALIARPVAVTKKEYYTATDLKKAKADELRAISGQVITAVKKIKNLHYYGLTADDLKDAQFYYDEFAAVKNAPNLRRKEAASRNEEMALGVKEGLFILENTIDPLMQVATEGDAHLRNAYLAARKVLPRGQGRMSDKEERYRKSRKRKAKRGV